MFEALLEQHSLILFVIAIIANGFSAMAGGGAGLLQLPILLFMGLPFGTALATHKVATVALGIGSTLRYRSEQLIDVRFALMILMFGLPGVVFGSMVILHVDDALATLCLGVLTICLGIYSVFKKQLGQNYQEKNRHVKGFLFGGSVVFLIGLANGSLTSGTGLFATLWFIHWFGLDYKRAVAMTMVLVGFFWNATGAITLSLIGEVQWAWVIPLVLGSLLGGYLGANIALVKGNVWIKRLFEALTLITGLSLVIKVLFV